MFVKTIFLMHLSLFNSSKRYRLPEIIMVAIICGFSIINSTAATVAVHDPSVVIVYKDANGNSYPENDGASTRTKYYYVFGTQLGAAFSKDMINWTPFTPTFSNNGVVTTNYYQLIKSEADYAGHLNSNDVRGNLWAPDIIYNKALGKWTLYFSLSGIDFQSSIILFSSNNIEGPYERVGAVVYGGFTNSTNSNARNDYTKVTGSSTIDGRYLDNSGKWDNTYAVSCIDPSVLYDETGKLWLAYGSWSGGIFMIKLNEQTGLRDYTYNYGFGANPVWNGNRLRYDPYMGIHLAGGYYVSGEGSYIKYIKDADGTGYYYMFISMGFYSPDGGYTMRVFRSSTIDGQYTDVTGDNAVFQNYVFNYGTNTQYGMPIMQNYKYNWQSIASVAQGHNSVLTDEDGTAYIIYHTKFDNGTAWHKVVVHQLFFNEKGWPLAAPFEYRKGFGLHASAYSIDDIVGLYGVITHNTVDYANLASNHEEQMYLNADGTISGVYTGTWSYNFANGKQYITLVTTAGTFDAVLCDQLMDGLSSKTIAFTGMNASNERIVWGYRYTNTLTTNTTKYTNQLLSIGNSNYDLKWDAYSEFHKETVSGNFEIEYIFDNHTLAAENWHNWAVAFKNGNETWYLRADAWSNTTFSSSTVNYAYNWDWNTEFKEVFANKKVRLKLSKIGSTINVFAFVDSNLVYRVSAQNAPSGTYDVYLGGEAVYLQVKKIAVSQVENRQLVGTVNEDGTYPAAFNTFNSQTTNVSGDFELHYSFNNYHNPISTDNWDNYIIKAEATGNPTLIRADAFAMDIVGQMTYTYDWNWADFYNLISGAHIDLTITRNQNIINYKAIITSRNGQVYHYEIIQTDAPTGNMSFNLTCEESMVDIFKVEKIDNQGSAVVTGMLPTSTIAVKIYSYGNTLYIQSESSGTAQVFDSSGRLITTLHYQKGINTYSKLPKGFYLVNKHKVFIY